MREFVTQYLTNQAIKVEPSKTKWVLTVPAIWDNQAKEIMRLAAEQAGIFSKQYDDRNHFCFALEPESAAICCRSALKQSPLKNGDTFMVLNCDGETIDITTYVIDDMKNGDPLTGNLKQIAGTQGDEMGGTFVDRAFIDFLEKLISKQDMQQVKTHKEFYSKFMKEFELAGKGVSLEDNRDFSIPVPNGIAKIFKNHILKFKGIYDEEEPSLIIPPKIFRSFFDKSIKTILKFAKDITEEVKSKRGKNLDYIFCVGGFFQYILLFESVKKEFADYKVVRPDKCGEAIVKGAVDYGWNSQIVNSRILSYSYGVDVCSTFDNEKDPEDRKICIDGVDYCKDRFLSFREKGQSVEFGDTYCHTLVPIHKDQKYMNLKFYQCPQKGARYIEDNMVKIATKILQLLKQGSE